jgi:hypothetical protein
MELESPIRTLKGEISIKVKILDKLIIDVNSPYTIFSPPDNLRVLTDYLIPIANEFENYSLKWMPSQIESTKFLDHIVHKWDHSTLHSQIDTNLNTFRQLWELVEIQIIRDQFILHWNLYYIQAIPPSDSSGQTDMNSIPFSDDTPLTIFKNPRARIREKIRRARIHVTTLKLKLKELTNAYYTRYGTLEGTHRESDLSSEIDSNIE